MDREFSDFFSIVSIGFPVQIAVRDKSDRINEYFLSSMSDDLAALFSFPSMINTVYNPLITIRRHIINAPSSTKNAAKTRDPEMHQTKKGNEWKFGMKCHIGVDAGSGLVHTMTVTAANEHDITQTANLLREDDEVVYGDSGYLGVQKRPEIASNEHFSKIDFRINRRPSSLPRVSDNAIDWERYIENRKSAVRCKVEHAFRIIKCQFGYRKTVYRGLRKNENRLYAMFACANLYALAMAGRKLSTT